MNPIVLIVHDIIYRPIFNLLILFLAIFDLNLWISIILLTIVIRLILLKPALAWNEMQKQMTDLQPKLKEIQEKYKDNQQKMADETMKILKTKWAWPLKWCLMLLIQMPVFIWLFFVVRTLSETEWIIDMSSLYSFLELLNLWWLEISQVNTQFLWLELLNSWEIILSLIAWILIFTQMKLATLNRQAPTIPNIPWAWANIPDLNKVMKFMNIFLALIMMSFVYSMPSWIWLYIVTTTTFSIIQFTIQYKEIIKIKLKSLTPKNKN